MNEKLVKIIKKLEDPFEISEDEKNKLLKENFDFKEIKKFSEKNNFHFDLLKEVIKNYFFGFEQKSGWEEPFRFNWELFGKAVKRKENKIKLVPFIELIKNFCKIAKIMNF